MPFLIGLLKPLALDFIVKRGSKLLTKLISKPDNLKEVAMSAVDLVSKKENVEDIATEILIQVAAVTPSKKDDKWIAFVKDIKGDVRSLITKIKAFREDY
jgi:hypothetical protein